VPGPPIDQAPFGAQTGVRFPGNAGAYLAVANAPVFQLENGTIALWFRPATVAGVQMLFAKDWAGTEPGQRSVLLSESSLVVRLETAGGTMQLVEASNAILPGIWYQAPSPSAPAASICTRTAR